MGSRRNRRTTNRPASSRGHWREDGACGEENFFHTVTRTALAAKGPLALLVNVSVLLGYSDPRQVSPSDPRQLTISAAGVPYSTTTARKVFVEALVADRADEASALMAVAAELLGPDDHLAKTIHADLITRPPLRPRWLSRLGDTQIHRAARLSHVLDESDTILLQVRVPAAHGDFTCLVTLDPDRSDAIVHAGMVPESIDVARTLISVPASDVRCDDVDLADARARLLEAVRFDALVGPRERDGWPECRALVEWLIRQLPEGGSADPRPGSPLVDVGELVKRFFGSAPGGLFGRCHVDLVESLIEFGCECGSGDPLRWNAVRAEQWMFDHVLQDDRLALSGEPEAAPYVLRAFIRFAHDELDVRDELTEGVLGAIMRWEGDYSEKLRQRMAQDDDWYDRAAGDG